MSPSQTHLHLRHLKTFLAVAEHLNVTRAAEHVHLAQSSVTEQIQALESDLGTALFERSRHGLKLTSAGRKLMHYADAFVALASEARSAVANAAKLETGEIAVGGLETLCKSHLPKLLDGVHREHPGIGLCLRVGNSRQLCHSVKSGDLDFAFIFGDGLGMPDVQIEKVGQDDLVVLVSDGHVLAEHRAVRPSDLANQSFLITAAGCIYREIFERAFSEAGHERPRVVGEFGSMGTILRLVGAGMGCALVPRLVVEDGNGVVAVPWVGGTHTVSISMVWRRQRVESRVMRLFLNAARRHFGSAKPADGLRQHATLSRL